MKIQARIPLYLVTAAALGSCTIHYYPNTPVKPTPTPTPTPTTTPAQRATKPASGKPTAAKSTKTVHTKSVASRVLPKRTRVTPPATSANNLPPNSPTYAERAPLAGFSVVERAAATDVGRGFDSISGRLGRSGCVDVLSSPAHGIRGARTSIDMMYVRNGYQLMDAVNVGAQASGIINLLSLGGKASYANSQSVMSDSEYLVLRVVVEGEKVAGKRFRLADSAKKILASKQRDKFYELCGDQFVAGYIPGIEFFVIAQVALNSVSDETTKSFGVSAGFPLLASVDIETAKSVYKAATQKLQSVHVFASGGDGTAELSITIKELLDNPTQFLPQAASSPAVLQLVLENYNAAENLPATASLLTYPLAREYLDTLIQLQRLTALQKLTTDAFVQHWEWWQGKLKDVSEECQWVDRGWLWSDWRTVCQQKTVPKALDGCQVAWLLDKRYQDQWSGNATIDQQACPGGTRPTSTRMCQEIRAAINKAPILLRESVLRCLERPVTCRTELANAARIRKPSNSEYYKACRPPLSGPNPTG